MHKDKKKKNITSGSERGRKYHAMLRCRKAMHCRCKREKRQHAPTHAIKANKNTNMNRTLRERERKVKEVEHGREREILLDRMDRARKSSWRRQMLYPLTEYVFILVCLLFDSSRIINFKSAHFSVSSCLLICISASLLVSFIIAVCRLLCTWLTLKIASLSASLLPIYPSCLEITRSTCLFFTLSSSSSV